MLNAAKKKLMRASQALGAAMKALFRSSSQMAPNMTASSKLVIGPGNRNAELIHGALRLPANLCHTSKYKGGLRSSRAHRF